MYYQVHIRMVPVREINKPFRLSDQLELLRLRCQAIRQVASGKQALFMQVVILKTHLHGLSPEEVR